LEPQTLVGVTVWNFPPISHATGTQMSEYRVYVIGDDGHFLKVIQLDCADDEAATQSAKQLVDGKDIEVWQEERKIAAFSGKS
jgi:hypothetical protein